VKQLIVENGRPVTGMHTMHKVAHMSNKGGTAEISVLYFEGRFFYTKKLHNFTVEKHYASF